MTLVVTMVLCGILVLLMGSYVGVVETQSLAVARSQSWNYAIVAAEAGVEEAMAHINSGVGTNNLATNSWASVGTGLYSKTNTLGSSYSVVTIEVAPAVTNAYPVIISKSYVPTPIRTATVSRTVQVNTKARITPPVPGGLVAMQSINFSGSGIATDSFDSSNTNYSTGGLYDSTKALDNGDVSILNTNSGSFVIQNATIKGTVNAPPGGTMGNTVTIGSGGSVGDSNWVTNGYTGVEPGHFTNNATYAAADVTLPALSWTPTKKLKNSLNVPGVGMFIYYFDNSTPWEISDISGSVYIDQTNVVLWVTNSLTIGSGSEIYIAPGASLTMYVSAAAANISGQGVVNSTGLAQDFTYYGLPSNTSITFGANAAFVGGIYAPEASFSLGGGGSSTYDFIGKALVQSIKMNGHYHFHFDQGLNLGQIFNGYAAGFWAEL